MPSEAASCSRWAVRSSSEENAEGAEESEERGEEAEGAEGQRGGGAEGGEEEVSTRRAAEDAEKRSVVKRQRRS